MSDGSALTAELPWPPSVNAYWRHAVIYGKPRTLLSKAGRQYRKHAGDALAAQGMALRSLTGSVAVHITAYPPDRRKRDLDNLPKGVLDALTTAEVWEDDSQVDDLRITRGDVRKHGALIITITQHGDQQLWLK